VEENWRVSATLDLNKGIWTRKRAERAEIDGKNIHRLMTAFVAYCASVALSTRLYSFQGFESQREREKEISSGPAKSGQRKLPLLHSSYPILVALFDSERDPLRPSTFYNHTLSLGSAEQSLRAHVRSRENEQDRVISRWHRNAIMSGF